ncbi:MAG TPA: BatD family protein, partial [Spirochaetia bacterium]|nr:BatD family protein [Spirochaetia bacterium]
SVEMTARSSSSSLFDSSFSGGAPARTYVVPGTPLHIEVHPLPLAGRPSDYTGLIGHFQLSVSASPTTVNVGDPITLTMKLTGGPGLASVEIPRLSSMPGFLKAFRIPADRSAGSTSGSTKTFTQSIRAVSDRVSKIPPVVIPYFDPTTGQYTLLKSAPVKLTVRPTHILTAKNLQGAVPARPAGVAGEPVASSKGINYNYEGVRVLERSSYSPLSALTRPVPLAAAVLPLLSFIGFVGFQWGRQSRGRAWRNVVAGASRELLRICSQEESTDRFSEVFSAFKRYLQVRLKLSKRIAGYGDLQGLLPKGELDEAVRSLFHVYETHRYSGSDNEGKGDAVETLVGGAIRVVRLFDGSKG